MRDFLRATAYILIPIMLIVVIHSALGYSHSNPHEQHQDLLINLLILAGLGNALRPTNS